MLSLFIRKGLGSGSFFPLEPGRAPYVLGRAAEATILLEDEGVSRRHAEITCLRGRWMIRDLGSRNGIYVNSLLVREHEISVRDLIVLGTAELFVVSRDAPSGAQADGRDPETSGTVPLSFSPLVGLVGQSASMQGVLDRIRRVAPLDVTVVLRGESGTGKELVARAIHSASGRSGGPFLAVNCGAVPETLVESELFGHEKGAFTGATVTRAGRFEAASGGTLFLDEVGDLPATAQVSLLRVLQEGMIRRVGGSEDVRVDVRIVAATHRDLERAVGKRTFRNDLYHRLCVFEIVLPPLRERLDDLPHLVSHFLAEIAAQLQRGTLRLTDGGMALLRAHTWPGNVRELRNVLERAAIQARSDVIDTAALEISRLPLVRESDEDDTNSITAADGAGASGAAQAEGSGAVPGSPGSVSSHRPGSLSGHLGERERELVRSTLEAANWNQSEAARRLGVSESKIRKVIRESGITKPGIPPRE